ncbi:MAG: 2-isopropylmalate synthase [Lachnospiraceae bacterium]|nr:2-isopropylmalate synthase [Lachnospiraceae bacterium]
MKNASKYERQYFMPPEPCFDWVQKEYIDKPPIWCSVDLRDGNQALIIPMSLEEKLEYFQTLVDVGFKEIEVGFPAASDTEYEFLRALIERNLIPEDVTIQVLTQAREHIIRKTFAALDGCPRAIVHVYNSTSKAQREQVFRKSKEEILKIAVDGAKLLKELAAETEGNFLFEYSPESFTGTEPEYALEVCNAVIDIWEPTPDWKVIMNLPVTVEHSLPHVYASQIEYMSKNMHNRENVILSLHPHNDRGCGVADTELALLAGADRVEGTLFGNGERTGNVDIITVAMNMFVHGVDPQLNFEDIMSIREVYERVTRMTVDDRAPYAGKLVFAAFSGSHQDAIAKGMKWIEEKDPDHWTVPYLPIDPHDVGREYEGDVIRINSQSGKGGVSFILEQRFGYRIPQKMREDVGYTMKGVSDELHKELLPEEILELFKEKYVNLADKLKLVEVHFKQIDGGIETEVTLGVNNVMKVYHGKGNGRLDAISNALKRHNILSYKILDYKEHSLTMGSNSLAVSYVGIRLEDGSVVWGAGIHSDIIDASARALFSAVNRALED